MNDFDSRDKLKQMLLDFLTYKDEHYEDYLSKYDLIDKFIDTLQENTFATVATLKHTKHKR